VTSPGGSLGKLVEGGGDYSWRKPGGSSQRVAATTPGDVAGDAPRPYPDLRRETMPEDGPTSSDDHSWKKFGRKKLPNLHANTITGKSRGGDPRVLDEAEACCHLYITRIS